MARGLPDSFSIFRRIVEFLRVGFNEDAREIWGILMATGTINSNADPLKWKQLFDAALDELSGDTQRDRKKPIYQRKAVVNELEPDYKRTDRALATAADALAALWKMPVGKPILRASSERNPR